MDINDFESKINEDLDQCKRESGSDECNVDIEWNICIYFLLIIRYCHGLVIYDNFESFSITFESKLYKAMALNPNESFWRKKSKNCKYSDIRLWSFKWGNRFGFFWDFSRVISKIRVFQRQFQGPLQMQGFSDISGFTGVCGHLELLLAPLMSCFSNCYYNQGETSEKVYLTQSILFFNLLHSGVDATERPSATNTSTEKEIKIILGLSLPLLGNLANLLSVGQIILWEILNNNRGLFQ